MNENKTMEHLDLQQRDNNKLENIFLAILVFFLIGAIVIQVTSYNPFISQINQGTKIVGEIISSKNEVKIKRYGEIIWTEHDGKIYENSQLMTGNNSSAKLKIDDQEVTVAANTIIEFKKKDTLNTLIDIQEGDIGVKGHTNKVSYTVNNQSVESKDNKSSFSLSSQGIKQSAGAQIKEVEVIKPKVVLPPPKTNEDLLLIAPKRAEIINKEDNEIDFVWTGNDRKPVTLEISRDKAFEKEPLFKSEISVPRKTIKLKVQGRIYWRVYLGEKAENAPSNYFFIKKPGEAKLLTSNNPVLEKTNLVIIEHDLEEPVFLEVSKLETFKTLDKRLQVTEKKSKIRLNHLGTRYLRVVDNNGNILAPAKEYSISPDTNQTNLSYLQNKNALKVSWADHVKKIPELYYLLRVTGNNSTKEIESVSSNVEFELPETGEYTARLYAKEKGTKGLLLNTKKIQYKRIEKKAPPKKPDALRLKKEIIIK